jgi:[CysO sulfur-carrier protein]-thiocarboxylate-dependent cysteine synthase
MKYSDITSMVGQTPHVRVSSTETPGAQIYAKLEGYNPTGSVKDRACLNMMRTLEREGKLRAPLTLLDASSGNFACAVALFAKLFGFSATLVVNSKVTADKRNFLEYFGAEVIQVGDFTIEGNRYCRDVLLQREPGKYLFLDQLHNWSNPRAYYESIGPEILADFPNIAMVVGSLGSGGTMNGTGRFLKEKKPGIKIVAVEAAAGTKLPGTGAFDEGDYVTPFIQSARDEGVFDHVVKITEHDAVRRTAQLREQGIFCGLQTGGVMHAAITAINKFKVEGEVVIVSGDTGWKNLEKLLHLRF